MMSKKNIWILEDDESAHFVYKECLEIRYDLQLFSNLTNFRKRLLGTTQEKPELLIADLRLPGETFLNFLSNESSLLEDLPFLVVSSVDDLDALRFCFEKGAIDYLTKPFGKGELVVKIERAVNQGYAPPLKQEKDEELSIDPTSLRVVNGHLSSAPLTSKEFQIFTTLKQAPEKKLSRDRIVAQVWKGVRVESKTLDVHLFNLRKKLSSIGVEIEFKPPGTYHLLRERVHS